MAGELAAIHEISDVSYLLARLRLAIRSKETEMEEAIVSRLRELGVLSEAQAGEHVSFKNPRANEKGGKLQNRFLSPSLAWPYR